MIELRWVERVVEQADGACCMGWVLQYRQFLKAVSREPGYFVLDTHAGEWRDVPLPDADSPPAGHPAPAMRP